jgi:hypothetical protein
MEANNWVSDVTFNKHPITSKTKTRNQLQDNLLNKEDY